MSGSEDQGRNGAYGASDDDDLRPFLEILKRRNAKNGYVCQEQP